MEEQQEVWKDIIIEKNGVVYDYTGLYQVSNLGRLKSYVRNKDGKIISPKKNKNGYMYMALLKMVLGKDSMYIELSLQYSYRTQIICLK